MKLNLLFPLLTACFVAVSMPSLSAASSAALPMHQAVSAMQTGNEKAVPSHFKKEKCTGWLKKWWGKKATKHFQKSKFVQRLSLGFVGLLVMILGGMFIVLGIVIPVVGVLFLVIGIIIAFVGLLLWALLNKVGVDVNSSGGRRQN